MAMSELLSAEAIERGLVLQGVPKDRARAEALRQVAERERIVGASYGVPENFARGDFLGMPLRVDRRCPPDTVVAMHGERVVGAIKNVKVASPDAGIEVHMAVGEHGDALRVTLHLAPRTKKNSTTLGIKQSKPYRAYRDQIIRAFEPLRLAQLIPLPVGEYNIAAVYYVDRYGKRADKVGLDQGLYDALENAGVVTNDWQFRTADGTRIVLDDPAPRVEFTITPLE